MLGNVYKRFQGSTLFEKLLLLVGLSIGIVGFWLINTLYLTDTTLSWEFIIAVFLWLLMIFVVILTASNESIKEELSVIINKHIEETKLVKEEVSLLNRILSKKRKK